MSNKQEVTLTISSIKDLMDCHRHLQALYIKARQELSNTKDSFEDVVIVKEGRSAREAIQWQLNKIGVDFIK